jgi:DNA-binding MarR family transcriptional regulator
VSSDRRSELLAAIEEAMRDNAGRGLMLHQSIAERFGLNATDLKCLDLARNETELTAGRIATATRLSTSAVTAVLDRLERRGFIDRQRDPADRRKVVVVSTGRHEGEVREIFASMGEAFGKVLADYDDDQLAFLLDFVLRLNDTAREVTAEVTAPEARSPTAP